MSERDSICAPEEKPVVEYRDIPGFPGYRAGSDGTIWSCWTRGRRRCMSMTDKWHVLHPSGGRGYRGVKIKQGDSLVFRGVHRLVLMAFVGPCPPGMQACHYPDRSRANNALSNLRWDTPAKNNADKVEQGTHQCGENNGCAKLTREQIREIRVKFASGQFFQRQLAEMYGVAQATVSKVIRRTSWR